MLWDAESLYIAAEMVEPHVWSTLTERDSVVYHDNDFEVFIDPDGDALNYYEIEVNALNTVFDLLIHKPYRDSGTAQHDWDVAGLQTAVSIDGSLNDPTDKDRGWTVEMAIPWPALTEHARVRVPPAPGDAWWFNFSRVQWSLDVIDGQYRKIPSRREQNWVWSPQGEVDMHIPHRWGRVHFVHARK